MKSYTLSDSRIRDLRSELENRFGTDPLPDDALLRFVEYEDGVITIDGEARLYYDEDKLYPLIPLLLEDNFLKQIVVDMGAVEPVVSGADVMAPGVTDADKDIQESDVVSVVDEDNGKPIGVAVATTSGEDIVSSTNGVAAQSQHYVGDTIWDTFF